MTLKDWHDKIHATDRIAQSATHSEVVEALDLIADDMMAGRTTMLHASTILDLAFALRSPAERESDRTSLEAHLSEIGAKGGASMSEVKRMAARANGAKGGAPRKVYQVEHDNGTDGGSWLRAHLDFDELSAEYTGRRAAEAAAKQARLDHPEFRFRVVER